ncbi:hypothetical protein H9P43_005074 [Blastocladiella emersonii ATCC 22665]|nr:hypothetical protein H9P43_005074 [Blastocladiella emersonii ATCC 22665]
MTKTSFACPNCSKPSKSQRGVTNHLRTCNAPSASPYSKDAYYDADNGVEISEQRAAAAHAAALAASDPAFADLSEVAPVLANQLEHGTPDDDNTDGAGESGRFTDEELARLASLRERAETIILGERDGILKIPDNEVFGPLKAAYDFEYARMLLSKLDLNEREFDELMAFDREFDRRLPSSFSSFATLRARLEESKLHRPFTFPTVTPLHLSTPLNFPKRCLLQTILDLFGNPKFRHYTSFRPVPLAPADATDVDGAPPPPPPVIGDLATASAWRAAEASLAERFGSLKAEHPSKPGTFIDRILIPFIFYSDKADVSANTSAHPAYVRLGNHDPSVESMASYRGMPLVGVFPYVTEAISRALTDTKRAAARRDVLHQCLALLLGDPKFAAAVRDGVLAVGPDGKEYIVHPWFCHYSTDLQEIYTLSHLRGANSAFPCPECMVPANMINANTLAGHDHCRRSQEETERLVDEYSSKTDKEREEMGRLLSIFLVKSGLWSSCRDVYLQFGGDPLHTIDIGITKYVIDIILDAINLLPKTGSAATRTTAKARKLVDTFMSSALPFSSFYRSRKTSVLEGTKTMAYEYSNAVKVLALGLFALGPLPHVPSLFPLVRAYVDFVHLIRLPKHTAATLQDSDDALALVYRYMDASYKEIIAKIDPSDANVAAAAAAAAGLASPAPSGASSSSSSAPAAPASVLPEQGEERAPLGSAAAAAAAPAAKGKKDEYKRPTPIKLHLLRHYRALIERFGPIDMQGSQRGEKEHSVTTKGAARHTNFNYNTFTKQLAIWVSLRDTCDAIGDYAAFHRPDLLSPMLRREFKHTIMARGPPPPTYAVGEPAVALVAPVAGKPLLLHASQDGIGVEAGQLHPAAIPLLAAQPNMTYAPLPDDVRHSPPLRVFARTASVKVFRSFLLSVRSTFLHGHEVNQSARAHAGLHHGRQVHDGILFETGGEYRIGKLVQLLEFKDSAGGMHEAAVVDMLRVSRQCTQTGLVICGPAGTPTAGSPAHGRALVMLNKVVSVLNIVPSPHLAREHLVNGDADRHSFMALRDKRIRASLGLTSLRPPG